MVCVQMTTSIRLGTFIVMVTIITLGFRFGDGHSFQNNVDSCLEKGSEQPSPVSKSMTKTIT